MDRCEEGPVMVIYPEGTWYTYVDRVDIDEIFPLFCFIRVWVLAGRD
jgi:(2Fe-2S) ferredoxin